MTVRQLFWYAAQAISHPPGPHASQNCRPGNSEPPPRHPMPCADAECAFQHRPLAVLWSLACCCLLLFLLFVTLVVKERTWSAAAAAADTQQQHVKVTTASGCC
jgi:hypothetical protein